MLTRYSGFAIAISTFCAAGAYAAPPGLLPTNLPDAYGFPAPPAGFDPLHASDGLLRTYGFPARPNRLRSRAYEGWARMVSAAKIPILPALARLDVRHAPMIPAAVAPPASGMAYSTNWSGTVLTTGASSFGPNSFYTLWGEFNVPIAQDAFGTCNSNWVYSSTWIGLDGYNGGADLVQGGTESDAHCSGGTTTGRYYAWYEWYPANAVAINNFAVAPGDDIAVQVGVSSTTVASMFMTNETTNQFTAVQFDAPAGTTFVGNTAEWVVERPEVNKVISTLANYGADWMSNFVAALNNSGHTIVGGNFGANGIPTTLLTMVDTNGNGLSAPSFVGGAGDVFHVEGSAK